ncbi:MAG: alpha-amylase family glycosyl hydrolase [Lentimicrobiaceae bacterium]|jgi:glycosidase
MRKIVISVLSIVLCINCSLAQNKQTPFNEPPSWAKNVIWYQVFVERFNNGDKSNDPRPENMDVPFMKIKTPEGWSVTPWTWDWYKQEDWAVKTGKQFNDAVQYRRYGGDLQGVLNKLDYLQDLGVTALFMNPLNDAPSLHKYDARNYHHVDVNFGPDPVGDNKLIASEKPNDPTTWKWTSADKMFLKLVAEAHKRGMKIILDYSWNHTGTSFWAFEDVVKNQSKSEFKDWYNITSFDNPATSQYEFAYQGWLGNKYLPEIKKVDITTERRIGHAYEGNINEGAKQHIFAVSKRWLAPDGDVTKGIDGFRLDVADHIGLGFWRDYRKFVRSVQPETYLIGEIWWEQWPDQMMNPVPFTSGDVFDEVMFYQVYRPARYFFAKTDFEINAAQFKDSLEFQWNRLLPANRYAMMNTSSTHDTPRLLSDFYNPNKYKYHANPNEDKEYKTGKPDAETYKRLQLYLVHLFTSIGAPQIWNGEEMGMWGADDPNCRKPLMWKEYKFDPETRNNFQPGPKTYDKVIFNQSQFDFYKKLIKIRKNNPVLATGDLTFLAAEGKRLAYKRSDMKDEIIVIFNLESTTQSFSLPQNTSWIDLLTNKKITTHSITLKKLSAAILKKSE